MTRTAASLLVALMMTGCGGSMRTPAIAPANDDQTILARVRTALLNDPVVHANEITVTAQNGVVVLTGQVHGTREADAAVAVARRIPGVTDVKSELQTNR